VSFGLSWGRVLETIGFPGIEPLGSEFWLVVEESIKIFGRDLGKGSLGRGKDSEGTL
jgi:hypothetical protein